ncbi:hypothetical protein BpHYR1_054617 [Brachionus plicatilis]|uniref:Uncharacterized protein n=1 Tax=Brachionus plicatilis TaxID=10195 RepID=A0A3M7QYL3_BRAPC|nr:hypothetical protein BpHYR1_054617 [Brachionus plicatilis]
MYSYPNFRQPPKAQAEYQLPFKVSFGKYFRAFPIHHVFDKINSVYASIANDHASAEKVDYKWHKRAYGFPIVIGCFFFHCYEVKQIGSGRVVPRIIRHRQHRFQVHGYWYHARTGHQSLAQISFFKLMAN